MTLDTAIATPREAKLPPFSREEAMSEKEKHILRSSNSLNKQQPPSENSCVPDGPEAAVNEKKRKGDARNASIVGEQESNRLKKTAAEPPWVVKNLERSKALSRAAAAAAATHKVLPTPRSLALNKLNKMRP